MKVNCGGFTLPVVTDALVFVFTPYSLETGSGH